MATSPQERAAALDALRAHGNLHAGRHDSHYRALHSLEKEGLVKIHREYALSRKVDKTGAEYDSKALTYWEARFAA